MKSYFANSVQAAMSLARKELGSDAVLVTSRPAPPEGRKLGACEVVFATDLPAGIQATAPSAAPAASAAAAPPLSGEPVQLAETGSILAELRELRRQFQAWKQAAMRCSDHPSWMAGQPELAGLYGTLMAAEVDRDLAQQMLSAVLDRARGQTGYRETAPGRQALKLESSRPSGYPTGCPDGTLDPAFLQCALREELERAFSVDSSLGGETGAGSPRMVALVGPPGAGKTAMLAKLAVRYGLSGRKPMQFLSLDTLRVAASEQLRCYAGLLGVGFQVVETTRGLGQALEEHRHKELILIDTPGLAPHDLAQGDGMADYLARRTDIQTHLVLPASMRSADMARISAAYDCFRPSRLIFTRLDETGTFGPVLCEAASTNRPISFFSTGQRVPEDVEPAAKKALVDRLLPPAGLASQAQTTAA
jgi:flagellar biosynthesis protein FlhF